MTGPHPLPPDDERALKTTRDNAMGATFQAMAEAMHANAEALHKIDSSQRQMAESLRKNEKVTQVVTSTKALNETFRGLSEIQRGLLETLVRDRGNRGSSSPWAYLAIAVLAGLLGILVWERLTDDGRLPRELYEQARARTSELSQDLAAATAREKEFEARLRDADGERNELRLARQKQDAEIERLNAELERNKAQMGNYLQAKEQADAAGAVMLANDQLQRETGDLRRQLERLRAENEGLWKKMADGVLDGRMGDPEAILKRARDQGVLPPGEADPRAPAGRQPVDLTLIRRKLRRLFEGSQGDEGYELLMLKGVEQGSTLVDVEVGRYENHLTVGSILCKRLEIRVDAEKDAVELRLHDGYLVNLNKPGEKIALDPLGHSVFLQGVGVKNWLQWAGPAVSVAEDGLLRWN